MSRWPLALLCVFIACVPWTQRVVDGRLGPFRSQEEVLYVWSGEKIRRMTPGFHDFMADIYWLRTVQYFGGLRAFARERRFELLEPLIDITVTLDPRFQIVYRYGATFLAEPSPTGAGKPEVAIALLDRGCRNIPRNWRIKLQKGYFIFLFLRDAKRASETIWDAARINDDVRLRNFAASILIAGNEREAARLMWTQIYDDSEEKSFMRRNAGEHLRMIDAIDRAAELARLVAVFERRHGRRPGSLDELVVSGLVRSRPVDPSGAPFFYDPATGRVDVSDRSPLYRRTYGGFDRPQP